jgi:hypothetical protein
VITPATPTSRGSSSSDTRTSSSRAAINATNTSSLPSKYWYTVPELTPAPRAMARTVSPP